MNVSWDDQNRNIISFRLPTYLLMRAALRSPAKRLVRQIPARSAFSVPHRSAPISAPCTPWLGLRLFSATATYREGPSAITAQSQDTEDVSVLRIKAQKLPLSCPGCGAPSQTVASTEAGYYSLTRSGVKRHVNESVKEEDEAFNNALGGVDKNVLTQLGLSNPVAEAGEQSKHLDTEDNQTNPGGRLRESPDDTHLRPLP